MKRKKMIILRINHGMTQKEFGDTLGYEGQYISQIETGRTNGGMKFWYKVRTTYNIPEEEIESYKELT